MAVQNSTIITKAWLEGSNDFQQRIPDPQVSGYDNAITELFQPYNHDLFNQFANLLVGMNGTYVESKRFENPLRVLFKPALTYGNSERHVAVQYLNAHASNPDTETLLKLEKPEFKDWFYSVQKPRRYDFSWSVYEMRRVFSDPDGYGFDALLAATIDQTYSSDAYDEMNIIINQFAFANARLPLYKEHLSAAPTTKELGQELLVKIRAIAGRMQFPTRLYNNIPVPVFESPQTLVLWVTPEVDAYLDVMALADIFHEERAEVNYRKILIPEFPIPNVYAALTSEDFIYARDVWYGMEPPFYNPENMTYKYYLQHAEMIGVNPAANCVLFTTDEGTSVPTITMAVNGLAFSPAAVNCPVGGSVKLNLELQGSVSPTGAPVLVQPDAATYKVAGADSAGKAVSLNDRTYVDANGVLHVQDDLTVGDVITVTATSSYIDPSAATTAQTATATVTLTAAEVKHAKETFVDTNTQLVYTPLTDASYTPEG